VQINQIQYHGNFGGQDRDLSQCWRFVSYRSIYTYKSVPHNEYALTSKNLR